MQENIEIKQSRKKIIFPISFFDNTNKILSINNFFYNAIDLFIKLEFDIIILTNSNYLNIPNDKNHNIEFINTSVSKKTLVDAINQHNPDYIFILFNDSNTEKICLELNNFLKKKNIHYFKSIKQNLITIDKIKNHKNFINNIVQKSEFLIENSIVVNNYDKAKKIRQNLSYPVCISVNNRNKKNLISDNYINIQNLENYKNTILELHLNKNCHFKITKNYTNCTFLSVNVIQDNLGNIILFDILENINNIVIKENDSLIDINKNPHYIFPAINLSKNDFFKIRNNVLYVLSKLKIFGFPININIIVEKSKLNNISNIYFLDIDIGINNEINIISKVRSINVYNIILKILCGININDLLLHNYSEIINMSFESKINSYCSVISSENYLKEFYIGFGNNYSESIKNSILNHNLFYKLTNSLLEKNDSYLEKLYQLINDKNSILYLESQYTNKINILNIIKNIDFNTTNNKYITPMISNNNKYLNKNDINNFYLSDLKTLKYNNNDVINDNSNKVKKIIFLIPNTETSIFNNSENDYFITNAILFYKNKYNITSVVINANSNKLLNSKPITNSVYYVNLNCENIIKIISFEKNRGSEIVGIFMNYESNFDELYLQLSNLNIQILTIPQILYNTIYLNKLQNIYQNTNISLDLKHHKNIQYTNIYEFNILFDKYKNFEILHSVEKLYDINNKMIFGEICPNLLLNNYNYDNIINAINIFISKLIDNNVDTKNILSGILNFEFALLNNEIYLTDLYFGFNKKFIILQKLKNETIFNNFFESLINENFEVKNKIEFIENEDDSMNKISIYNRQIKSLEKKIFIQNIDNYLYQDCNKNNLNYLIGTIDITAIHAYLQYLKEININLKKENTILIICNELNKKYIVNIIKKCNQMNAKIYTLSNLEYYLNEYNLINSKDFIIIGDNIDNDKAINQITNFISNKDISAVINLHSDSIDFSININQLCNQNLIPLAISNDSANLLIDAMNLL